MFRCNLFADDSMSEETLYHVKSEGPSVVGVYPVWSNNGTNSLKTSDKF